MVSTTGQISLIRSAKLQQVPYSGIPIIMNTPSEITVTVGKLPGAIKTGIKVNSPATVQDALAAAQVNPDGYEIRVNNNAADLNSEIKDGNTILLVLPVKGN
jgi:sulfur carrier protein ThiS